MESVDESSKEGKRGIGNGNKSWVSLRSMAGATKIAAETQEAAYDKAKGEFDSHEIGVGEPVTEYFARVHVVLTKPTRHQVTTPARETKCRVLSDLAPRYPDEVCFYDR